MFVQENAEQVDPIMIRQLHHEQNPGLSVYFGLVEEFNQRLPS
jgi:hypothetical protein